MAISVSKDRSGGKIHHLAPDTELWAPDLTRRGASGMRDALDRDTEDMLRDWQAARIAARG